MASAPLIIGIAAALAIALPLAWKWQLGVLRSGLFLLSSGAVFAIALGRFMSLTPVTKAALAFSATMTFALMFLLFRFYRDPERQRPRRPDVIVSPADGQVIYVREARNGVLPISTKQGRNYRLEELTNTTLELRDAAVIGISMSFLDVHVNRVPFSGRVTAHAHVKGRFGSLRDAEMIFQNERATTVIHSGAFEVAVVQIASRLVRQIATFVTEGQAVAAGARMGVIRFGSQVDLVLPLRQDITVTVTPGSRVRAGESVVAIVNTARSSASDQKSCQVALHYGLQGSTWPDNVLSRAATDDKPTAKNES